MPVLDYALLCDYVRLDAGAAHIIAANIDTLTASTVPVPHNLGILAVFLLAEDEIGAPHPFRVVARTEEGTELARINAEVRAGGPQAATLASWPHRASVGLNFEMLYPDYGVYAFDVFSGDELAKTLLFRVIRPDAA